MEQGHPTKWNPQVVAYGSAALLLVVVLGGKAALGSAWNVVFAAVLGLMFLWFCVDAYRRRDQPDGREYLFILPGWAMAVAGATMMAAGANGVGLPVMLLGFGLTLAGERLYRRTAQTEK
jgi:DMSO reductase anchor subunit